MYYSIFEGRPYEDKLKVAEQYYVSLVPRVKQISDFVEDSFFGSPHNPRSAVNIAEWKHEAALNEWRNESNHLRLQAKASNVVYESYRLRLGPAVDASDSVSEDGVRQYAILYYRDNVDGTPEDDVTSLLEPESVSIVKEGMLDSSVFQGPRILWVSGWRSAAAASKFEKAIPRIEGDSLSRVRVERDYTKSDRKDAPSENPGEVSRL